MASNLQAHVLRLENELASEIEKNKKYKEEAEAVRKSLLSAREQFAAFESAVEKTLDEAVVNFSSSQNKITLSSGAENEVGGLYEKYKNIELANKNIRILDNRLTEEYAVYTTVRRLVRGLIDNLDFPLITDVVIEKSVERSQLASPDYYLSAVLSAISAWIGDRRVRAEAAVSKALSLDKKSASLFFMLFNIGILRYESAQKWFDLYVSCDLIESDSDTFFMLLSFAGKTPNRLPEKNFYDYIFGYIKERTADDISRYTNNKDLISEITKHYETGRSEKVEGFGIIKEHIAQSSELFKVLSFAKNNINILDTYYKYLNTSKVNDEIMLRDYIDQLTDKPHPSEKHIYDEIAFNEKVIECEGDIERAKEEYTQGFNEMKNPLNCVGVMIRAFFFGKDGSIDGFTQNAVIRLTKELHLSALSEYAKSYRVPFQNKLELTIDDYSTVINTEKREIEYYKIFDWCDRHKKAALQKGSFIFQIWGIIIAAVTVVAGIKLSPIAFTASAAALIFTVLGFLYRFSKRGKIKADCEIKEKYLKERLADVFDQYDKLREECVEYDKIHEKIVSEIIKS